MADVDIADCLDMLAGDAKTPRGGDVFGIGTKSAKVLRSREHFVARVDDAFKFDESWVSFAVIRRG
jgi:hypothetical protein